MVNLSDVTVEYTGVILEDRQMAEFYACDGSRDYAIVKRGDRQVRVAVNGEMYLTIPREPWTGYDKEYTEEIIRYPDELEQFAKNDKEFWDLIQLWSVEREYQVYHMNPWWEVYSSADPEGWVYDTFDEALTAAIDIVKEDEYWNNLS